MKFLFLLSCLYSIAVCSSLSSPKVLRTFPFSKGTTVEIEEPSFFSQVGLQRSWDSLWGTEFVRYERTFFQVDDYVTVVFPTALPDSFASSFILAAQVWNEVLGASKVNPLVFDDAFSVNSNLANCQLQQDFVFPAGSSITGLVIIAEVFAIDGPGSVLGFAGPCMTTSGFPRLGRMRFDSADVENMLAGGTFPDVIKHEMGHVVGIGTLWGNRVIDRCTTFNPCNGNPKFIGANAIQGFNSLGGTGDLLVADAGGAGSANAHWRETTFKTELMSPSIAGPGNPLSIITIMSLIDIGYNVNVGRAENYQIPGVALPPGTTFQPTPLPTPSPTKFPTPLPTPSPTKFPTPTPTPSPSKFPTPAPTLFPSNFPTSFPTPLPTPLPTPGPTPLPTPGPTPIPTIPPTGFPTNNPSSFPTPSPTVLDLGDDVDNTPAEDSNSVLDRFRRRGEQFMIGVLSACGLFVLVVVALITLRIKRRGRAVGRVSSRIPKAGPQGKQVPHYLDNEKDAKMSAIAREL